MQHEQKGVNDMARNFLSKARRATAYLNARFSPLSPLYLRTVLAIEGHLSVDECKLLFRLAIPLTMYGRVRRFSIYQRRQGRL